MIGTILLNRHNHYLVNGELPKRPDGDKELLQAIVCNGLVTAEGAKLLPKSILRPYAMAYADNRVAVTIPELGQADILLVNRAKDEDIFTWKEFRLDNHHKVAEVEVWLKNL